MDPYDLRVNNHPHALDRLIEAGEAFTITKAGEPVAVCIPIDEYERLISVRTPIATLP